MISGGNATIFVSDMDRAINFYTNVLGLKLRMRAENYWAEVEAGPDLLIGLHPESPVASPPGTAGSIQIGLNVTEPLEAIQERLSKHGVNFLGDIVSDDGVGRFVRLTDLDGNQLYFWESKPAPANAEES